MISSISAVSCPLCSSHSSNDIHKIEVPKIVSSYFLCRHCSLRFLHPNDRLGSVEERKRYLLHENDVTDIRYQNFVKPLYQEIIQRIPSPAKGLDYGAGPGPVITELLRRQSYQMSLYDPYFWPDTEALDQHYDFVVACEVVEHFYDPALEFQKLRRLLRRGGLLALMTSLVTPQVDFATWYYRKDPTHVVFYSDQTIRWIANRFEFSSFEIFNDHVIIFSA